ncbi:MAG: TolC family protein [Cardiobacteriaceae bacterium]|nr:TolC family protein [Cardiobacteriaceae bacterium]
MNKNSFILGGILLHHAIAYSSTLEESWQAARLHSAQYRSAYYSYLAAQEISEQTKSQLRPQLAISTEHKRFSHDYGAYSQDWKIEAHQPLFNRPHWLTHETAQLSVQQADYEFKHQDSELLLNVSKAYLNVLLSHDKLKTNLAEQISYRQQIEQAKALFHSGEATILDTYEAEAGLDESIAKSLHLQTEKILAENQYRDLTGLSPQQITPITQQSLPDFTTGTHEQEWIDKALKNNASLQAQWLLVEKSLRDIEIAESEHLPQLNLTAGYQDNRHHQHGLKQHHHGAYIGLHFSIPIYSGGHTDSRIKQSKALWEKQQSIFEHEQNHIRLQVKQTWATLQGQKAQIQAQEKLLKSQIVKLEATRLGKHYGIRHSIDEIHAEQSYAEAQEKLASARYAYLEAWFTLLHLSGELTKLPNLDNLYLPHR